MLLLPVALVLAVAGALAFAMTREGGMNVAAVDAEYDTENARYLAEAGLALARWQNEKLGCGSNVGFGTVTLPGGQIVAQDSDIVRKGSSINVSLTATTSRGAANTLSGVTTRMHDYSKVTQTTVGGGGGNDTFIRVGSPNPGGASLLEITDGQSNALLNFPLPGGMNNAVVLKAELKLTQTDSLSTQPARSLSVYRVTTNWKGGEATWNLGASNSPWGTPGGDTAPNPVATVPIAGNSQYVWRIDALVDGWSNGGFANQGILLKGSGLLQAHFASFENAGNNPQLAVRYLPSC
jgi:hypothetical protein